jgi:hypothetical protein|tara:strand:- start:201 stop:398 length:198 start_codon:yes stop_codon:yes gene_type:complete
MEPSLITPRAAALAKELLSSERMLASWQVILEMKLLAGHCPEFAARRVTTLTGEVVAYRKLIASA